MWSWVDAGCVATTIIVLVDMKVKNVLVLSVLLLWVKFIGYVKGLNKSFATFVLMIQSIAGSIFAFCCLLGLIMLMFAHAC